MVFSQKDFLLLTATLSTLWGSTNSFQISFWGGAQCTSDAEGTFDHDYTSQGTCYPVPINAQSATVESNSPGEGLFNVAFFPSEDCSGGPTSSTDSGCVDFTALGGNALSYKIESDDQNPGRSLRNARQAKAMRRSEVVRNDKGDWRYQQDQARKRANTTTLTGSLSPHWDPNVHVEAGFGHGNVTTNWGKTWKWQQVAMGVSIGIPIEEWDDNIHTKSDEFIVFTDDDDEAVVGPESPPSSKRGMIDQGFTPADLSPEDRTLHMKRWNYGQCRALLSCGRQFTDSAMLRLGNGWRQTVQAWYRGTAYGRRFYDWAHQHPISVSIVVSTGSTLAGYGLGYTSGSNSAQDNDQLGDCGGESTQVQAFIQSFTQNGASNYNAAQMDITLPNGHILRISGEVYEKGHAPAAGNSCNADGKSS